MCEREKEGGFEEAGSTKTLSLASVPCMHRGMIVTLDDAGNLKVRGRAAWPLGRERSCNGNGCKRGGGTGRGRWRGCW